MTPDRDDDVRELLRRRAGSVTPRGTYADLERKLTQAAPTTPRWQRPLLLGVAAVLALVLGAGVVALATRQPGDERIESTTGQPATFETTTSSPPQTMRPAGTTTTTAAATPSSTTAPAVAGTTTTAAPVTPTTAATASPQPVTDASRVGLRGIGSVSLPLSLADLGRVTGQAATTQGKAAGATCSTVRLVTGPDDTTGTPVGVSFLVQDAKVVRVDVTKGSKVRTISGAGVGTSKAELLKTYPGAEVRAAKYSSPDQPIDDVVVSEPSAKGYELIFEVSGGAVTSYRAGALDAVELVEGCG